jgi:hypothetical protein
MRHYFIEEKQSGSDNRLNTGDTDADWTLELKLPLSKEKIR